MFYNMLYILKTSSRIYNYLLCYEAKYISVSTYIYYQGKVDANYIFIGCMSSIKILISTTSLYILTYV